MTTELTVRKSGRVNELKHCLYFKDMIEISYDKLYSSINWENEKVKSHGKEHVLSRMVARYGIDIEPYSFGGYLRKPIDKWPHILRKILKIVNKIIKDYIEDHPSFNFVVCNYYENGDTYIGYHSDGTETFVENSAILSLSVGESRDFLIRVNKTGQTYKIQLNDGDIFIMKYGFQDLYKHSVPVRKRVDKGRINLTFRVRKQ